MRNQETEVEGKKIKKKTRETGNSVKISKHFFNLFLKEVFCFPKFLWSANNFQKKKSLVIDRAPHLFGFPVNYLVPLFFLSFEQ